MILSDDDKEQFLLSFPNIKLSYENIIHNKVPNSQDFVSAIPIGIKCFVWFSVYNNNNVCCILELNHNPLEGEKLKGILDIKIMSCCFSSELVYGLGSIFYGTIFNNNYFTIEDIFYYKGKNVSQFIWYDKLIYLKLIMRNDIKQVSYNNSFIVFGLPIMKKNLDDINISINLLPYKINYIQFRNYNKKNESYIIVNNRKLYEKTPYNKLYTKKLYQKPIPQQNKKNYEKSLNIRKEIIFKVKPDITNDIYHLYCCDKDNKDMYYDLACIPDFKTSVLMNKLFRNIKENNNLDALEESDDEDEFEDDKIDKFVFLDKIYNMICVYNNKFKKWIPIKVVDSTEEIIKYNQLIFL